MTGLHEPVVIDTRVENFSDLHLTVHCVPGGLLSRQEASALCQKVGVLFENQGAAARTIDTVGRVDELLDAGVGEVDVSEVRTDLTLELRAREVHRARHPLSWAFAFATFTLVPIVREQSFAQDVVIRDGGGFLLASDTLEGRIVTRTGAGPWAGNVVADLFRDEDQKLLGNAAERDLSSDLYRQLSQLMFNAKMQWQVMNESLPLSQATERAE